MKYALVILMLLSTNANAAKFSKEKCIELFQAWVFNLSLEQKCKFGGIVTYRLGPLTKAGCDGLLPTEVTEPLIAEVYEETLKDIGNMGEEKFCTDNKAGYEALAGDFSGDTLPKDEGVKTKKSVSHPRNSKAKVTMAGLKIGDHVSTLFEIELKRLSRNAVGDYKNITWELPNGNRLTATYSSAKDEVVMLEIEWSRDKKGNRAELFGFKFGDTTLEDIRNRFGSNGFAYAMHIIGEDSDGSAMFNVYEIQSPSGLVVTFKTFVSNKQEEEINSLPPEQQQLGKIGEYFKLDSISFAYEWYLDEVWGGNKIYDPNSNPIELGEVDINEISNSKLSVNAQEKPTPMFSHYSVTSIYKGKKAPVILDTKQKRMFRTRLRRSIEYPVDFAGEYTLVTWGCGMSCIYGAVVSKKTGHIIWLPGFICCWDGEGERLMYRVNSRLLVTAGIMDEESEHGAHFYEFTGKEFKHLLTVPIKSKYN